mmetsp:Transcript_20812/g.51610  ORF Transcript_20812/g.51610 Transcript_20812/m.51610 type:complete len:88 (+) Transcript_20812:192-455(+)
MSEAIEQPFPLFVDACIMDHCSTGSDTHFAGICHCVILYILCCSYLFSGDWDLYFMNDWLWEVTFDTISEKKKESETRNRDHDQNKI